jgi:hypothetical protein
LEASFGKAVLNTPCCSSVRSRFQLPAFDVARVAGKAAFGVPYPFAFLDFLFLLAIETPVTFDRHATIFQLAPGNSKITSNTGLVKYFMRVRRDCGRLCI